MKKLFKKNFKVLVAIIITFLITVTGTVFAVDKIHARDVSFKPTNESFQVDDVNDALDFLYENGGKGEPSATLVLSYNYGSTRENPYADGSYTALEDGYILVDLGTRSLQSVGTTSYSVTLDGSVIDSGSLQDWHYKNSFYFKVKQGQTVKVHVDNKVEIGAAFFFIHFIK